MPRLKPKKILKKTGRLLRALPSILKEGGKRDVEKIKSDIDRLETAGIRKVKKIVKRLLKT